MGHDQLFKRFFHEFLQDFLELFYPDVAARLDFTTLEFLDKELFTDFPEGSVREADVVARVQTHEGTSELILVHLEIQSSLAQILGHIELRQARASIASNNAWG